MRLRAFTLLELLAVIAILGVLGSAVGVSLQRAAERSRVSTSLQRLSEFDSVCRRLARTHGGGAMLFDTASDRVAFRPTDPADKAEDLARSFSADLDSVMIDGTPSLLPEVRFNTQGISETYVAVFAGKTQQESVALHIAGGTGHVTRLDQPADALYMPY